MPRAGTGIISLTSPGHFPNASTDLHARAVTHNTCLGAWCLMSCGEEGSHHRPPHPCRYTHTYSWLLLCPGHEVAKLPNFAFSTTLAGGFSFWKVPSDETLAVSSLLLPLKPPRLRWPRPELCSRGVHFAKHRSSLLHTPPIFYLPFSANLAHYSNLDFLILHFIRKGSKKTSSPLFPPILLLLKLQKLRSERKGGLLGITQFIRVKTKF